MDRGVGSSGHSTRYPHFFQIIVPDNIGDGTLEIPQDFVEEHAGYLSMYDYLQLSTGKQWKVELIWGDGRVWLHKSWQQIIENCSIKDLRALLFRHEGGSLFHVFLFNKSGLDINHSGISASVNEMVKFGQLEVTMANEENGEDDTSDAIVDAWPIIRGRDDEVLQVKLAASVLAKEGVLQRAKAFQSPNPHFFVIMRSAYHSHLYIPAKPGRCYFYGKNDKSMYLFDPNGKAWFMTYRIGGSPLYQVIINLGWYGFAREHNLRHGDACIFELVNSKTMVFNITIIRLNEGEEVHQNSPLDLPGICSLRQTGKRKMSASELPERAKPLQCVKTSFTVVFKLNTQSLSSLCVPLAHASRYLMDQHENQVYLHGQAGRTWPCKCYVYRSTVNYVRLSTGWKDFVLDNDLREGDACVFQLLSQAPNHYLVCIVRVAAATKPN